MDGAHPRRQNPVLVVDVEVRRFGIEARVAELARRLQLPVLTTFMGRGLLAEDGVHPACSCTAPTWAWRA